MKLTYFGHSAFLLEIGATRLLFDPFITGNPHTSGVVMADDLTPDIIVLTHAHADHWGDTVPIAERTGALVVATYELTQVMTNRYGHERVQPMNTGGSWSFDWGRIKFTDARHSSSLPDGTYGGSAHGVIVHAEGKTLYDAGDTCPFAEMQWIGDDNDLDVALLPIGDCFTMGPEDSIRAVRMLRARRVVPLHYNTFPLIALEDEEFAVWEDQVRGAGSTPVILQPGAQLEI